MCSQRIGPIESDRSKKVKPTDPDSKLFRELMKVEKTREIELEKQRKRRLKKPEEEEEEATVIKKEAQMPSPYETGFYEKKEEVVTAPPPREEYTPPPPALPEEEDLPSSPDFWEKVDISTLISKKEEVPAKEEKPLKKPPKIAKGKIEKKEEAILPEEKITKPPYTFVEERAKIEEPLPIPKKEEPPTKEPVAPSIKEKVLKIEEEEKRREQEKIKISQIPITHELPHSVMVEAATSTSRLSPYLSPEVIPLFERMVGTIIHMSNQGISQTQIILNAPAFAASVFFGCKIILDRYSTAPNSFNIRLIGTPPAVSLFNENIEGLMKAFQRGNFSFRVGRLSAEYTTERPLIKRKKKIGKEREEGE